MRAGEIENKYNANFQDVGLLIVTEFCVALICAAGLPTLASIFGARVFFVVMTIVFQTCVVLLCLIMTAVTHKEFGRKWKVSAIVIVIELMCCAVGVWATWLGWSSK
jgi:hypothetical protein